MSLEDDTGPKVFFDEGAEHGISMTLRGSIGGVLQRAGELMLWYAPTINSYRRMESGEFSGNGLSWAIDSRMVSCRVLSEGPEGTRLEWRVPGADVNPYLAIASLLASARDGMATAADPREPLVGETGSVRSRSFQRRSARPSMRQDGIVRPGVLRQGRGDALRRGRRMGVGGFFAADAVTEWERRRYFEVI